MNAQARDELRVEMIDFACWITEEDPDDEDFIAAIEFFFACLARIYQCSSRAILEHYASEIGRLGEIEYFYRFRPELNLKTAFSK